MKEFIRKHKVFILSLFAGVVVNNILTPLIGEIAGWSAKHINSTPFFIEYVVPLTIGFIPWVLFVLMILFLTRKEKDMYGAGGVAQVSTVHDDFRERLNSVGIINVTDKLESSQYAPLQCMEKVNKKLFFMGILGSKWVNDEKTFEHFINKVEANDGEVKFLLVNPNGKGYQSLQKLRKGRINHKSLGKFYKYSKDYSCLQVKLYDERPNFRMAFLNDQELAVSRYFDDEDRYFESNQGWDNPHIIIKSDAKWSFYLTFEKMFSQIWDRSTEIEEFFSQKNS